MSWRIATNRADLLSGCWQIQFDPKLPREGIDVAFNPSSPIPISASGVLRIETNAATQPSLGECYVRDDDLISAYPEIAPFTFGLQLDYRLCQPTIADSLEIELWISVQTALLESYPSISIVPGFQTEELQIVTSHQAGRLAGNSVSWTQFLDNKTLRGIKNASILMGRIRNSSLYEAIAIHPMDQQDLEIEVSPAPDRTLRLCFTENFMEKGVIRRARLRWIVSSSPMSTANLSSAYQAFETSPLPLTV